MAQTTKPKLSPLSKSGRKTLLDRYNELNRAGQKEFRDFCIHTLGVSIETAYRWIRGLNQKMEKIQPPPIYQGQIAAYFHTAPTMIWFNEKAGKKISSPKTATHAK